MTMKMQGKREAMFAFIRARPGGPGLVVCRDEAEAERFLSELRDRCIGDGWKVKVSGEPFAPPGKIASLSSAAVPEDAGFVTVWDEVW